MFQMLLTQNILEKSWIVVKAYLGDNKELQALVNLMS
jgi:hypothetical protein